MTANTTNALPDVAFLKAEFFSRFQREEADLQKQISQLGDSTLTELDRAGLVTQCQNKISQMSNQVKDASSYLPIYDQRTYSTVITRLKDKLQGTRTAFAPKHKFAFKKVVPQKESTSFGNEGVRKAETQEHNVSSIGLSSSSTNQAGSNAIYRLIPASHEVAAVPIAESQALDSSYSNAVTVSSVFYERYILPLSSMHQGSSASITDIHHALVDVSTTADQAETFKTMTIRSVSESLLLCGCVSGAVHITGVQNSTLIVNSRQVRIHECKDCVVYLRCTSRPIIEDCKGILFAPLPSVFNVETPDSPNLWDQVDDFKWLRAEHSPNWKILSPDDELAVGPEAWETIIAGAGSKMGLDDLLRSAKIIR